MHFHEMYTVRQYYNQNQDMLKLNVILVQF